MQGLDEIPWHELHHAHGTAEDVPDLLRALRTARPDIDKNVEVDLNEDPDSADPDEDVAVGPLRELYGNIWHQNTVYEATQYTVPFLIQLASDRSVPDRCGILGLLASIARGSSYLKVHESFLSLYADPAEPRALEPAKRRQWREKYAYMIPGTEAFAQQKAKEIAYVSAAHRAVAEGLQDYLAITRENGLERYAAAHVLSRLNEHRDQASVRLLEMVQSEMNAENRARLMLQLARTKVQSPAILDFFEAELNAKEVALRRAAALGFNMLSRAKPSEKMKQAMFDLVLDAQLFEYFPSNSWFDDDDIYSARKKLFDRMREDREALIEQYLGRLKHDAVDDHIVSDLLDLVFPRDHDDDDDTCAIEHTHITQEQQRVLKALLDALDRAGWWSISWMTHGLPDSRRSLRELSVGRPCFQYDAWWPKLSLAEVPGLPASTESLQVGRRVHSRFWGYGVIKARAEDVTVRLSIDYDEEGNHTQSIMPETRLSQLLWRSLNPLRPWLGKSWAKPKTLADQAGV